MKSLMHHVKNALKDKSPKEKIEGQLRRDHGVVDGRGGKSLEWHHDQQKVHVLSSKKPFLASMTAGKRKHSDGKWHTKTYHWNDNQKITHKQDWTDQDHWHGEPPYRRVDGVHQENDRLDHQTEGTVSQFPGTTRYKRGDRVTHPDHPGVHVVYSTPPSGVGDGKAIALIHPEGHKFETDVIKDPTGMRGLKRVNLRDLKKAD